MLRRLAAGVHCNPSEAEPVLPHISLTCCTIANSKDALLWPITAALSFPQASSSYADPGCLNIRAGMHMPFGAFGMCSRGETVSHGPDTWARGG